MKTEFEATFADIDPAQVKEKLRKAGADLVRSEFLQKRVTFNLPEGSRDSNTWVRIRDEGDKITLSVKRLEGEAITDQKELCVSVGDFETTVKILEGIGCVRKAYQESKRERWQLGEVEITIDQWPFLDPFIEVEGQDEQSVKDVAEKLELDWQTAKFCAVGTLYSEKYGISLEQINERTPRIVFGEENPFVYMIKNKSIPRISDL